MTERPPMQRASDFDPEVAQLAWRRTVEFFDRVLRA